MTNDGEGEQARRRMVQEARDWAIAHGLLMQSKTRDGYFEHVPMSLEATPFPQMQYIRGVELARIFNTLVENISQNPEWLLRVLTPVQTYDSFTASLMRLQREVIDVGEKQKIHLGINRSDYMLHVPSFGSSGVDGSGISMLQVELNTIASSFGSLSALVTGLHKYLLEGRLRPRGVLGRPLRLQVDPSIRNSHLVLRVRIIEWSVWTVLDHVQVTLTASQVGGLHPPTPSGTYTRHLRTIFSISVLEKFAFQDLIFLVNDFSNVQIYKRSTFWTF